MVILMTALMRILTLMDWLKGMRLNDCICIYIDGVGGAGYLIIGLLIPKAYVRLTITKTCFPDVQFPDQSFPTFCDCA